MKRPGNWRSTSHFLPRSGAGNARRLPPPGEALTDWEILTALANRMGFDWSHSGPGYIFNEMAALMPRRAEHRQRAAPLSGMAEALTMKSEIEKQLKNLQYVEAQAVPPSK